MNIAALLKLNSLLQDLRAAASGVASAALVERGAGWIRELKDESPRIHELLMSVLYKDPVDVIDALAEFSPGLTSLRENENVVDYIARLQASIINGTRTAPLDRVTVHETPIRIIPKKRGKNMSIAITKAELLDLIRDAPNDAELSFSFAGDEEAFDILDVEIDTSEKPPVIFLIAADDTADDDADANVIDAEVIS